MSEWIDKVDIDKWRAGRGQNGTYWKAAKMRDGKVYVRYYKGGMLGSTDHNGNIVRMVEQDVWTFSELRAQYRTLRRAKQWGSADILRHFLKRWGQLPQPTKRRATPVARQAGAITGPTPQDLAAAAIAKGRLS